MTKWEITGVVICVCLFLIACVLTVIALEGIANGWV